jgi:ribosomal protein S18 acetylase RimI-like enzyme
MKMITYQLDKEEKYLNDLLFHLRAHNTSFTGEKQRENYAVYVLKNDVLLGAASLSLSWDWAGFNDLFYENIDVLQDLITKAKMLFKDHAVGIKRVTQIRKEHQDFLQLGFQDVGKVEGTAKSGTTYFADLRDFSQTATLKYHVISTKDVVIEYDEVFQQKIKSIHQENSINTKKEYLHYCAMDGETFVGGIYMELHEDYMYIDLLAVNKEYKGSGIGTKLMNYAEKEAKKRNYELINLGTTAFQARPFYEKLGYQVVFTRQDLPKGYECYTMIKYLNDQEERFI